MMSMFRRFVHISFLVSPLFAIGIGLCMGPLSVRISDIIAVLVRSVILSPFPVDDTVSAVILTIRLPRVLLAGLTGAALSVSGATCQGIFRNPLVDPFILGISAGSALGCALSIGVFPAFPIQVAAFIGGLAAVIITGLFAANRAMERTISLVLSGIMVSAFCHAMISCIKFLADPHRLQSIVFWTMGSFSMADWKAVLFVSSGLLAGGTVIWRMRWRLDVLSMGDEMAHNSGAHVQRERWILITASTLTTCLAVSVSGIIGWVGLMVPHMVRIAVGPTHRRLIPFCLAGGATFLILADTLARTLTTFDLPVGIMTATLGAPFFIWQMNRNRFTGWNAAD